MAITVNDFPALTDDLQEIFNEGAKRNVAEMVGNKVFEVRDTNRRTFDHLILHGVNGIQEVTPGADLPTVNTDEGDSITYTQRYFGGNFKVTKEMRKFDLYSQIEGLERLLTAHLTTLTSHMRMYFLMVGQLPTMMFGMEQ